MNYLVDANVLSEATRPSPDLKVLAWLERHGSELFLSAVTVGELQRGVALYPQSRKRAALAKWLGEVLKNFEGRILPVDSQIAIGVGQLLRFATTEGTQAPSVGQPCRSHSPCPRSHCGHPQLGRFSRCHAHEPLG